MPTDTAPTLIDQFSGLAKTYADARTLVKERVDSFQEEVQALYKRRFPGIKTAVDAAADAKTALVNAVEISRDSFKSPKSLSLHGVQFGLRAGGGKMEFEDEDRVVTLIKKHFPDQADLLILTEEKPSKEALEHLEAADLKKLGVSVSGSTDRPFIKTADGLVDKLVKRVLKEGTQIVGDES